MQVSEALVILNLLRRAYPRFMEASPMDASLEAAIAETAQLWAGAFANDDAAMVLAAAKAHIQSSKYVPTIAEIRALVDAVAAPAQASIEGIWHELQRLLQAGIAAADEEKLALEHMSPACRAGVIAAGGWWAVSVDGSAYIRRAFLKGAAEQLERERLPRLEGLSAGNSAAMLTEGGEPHG